MPAFWLPSSFETGLETRLADGISWPVCSPALIADLARHLRRRQAEVLARRTVDQLIEVLDAVAAQWLDPRYPLRQLAIRQIARVTGFSQAMVAHAIDLEQVSSRADDVRAALDNELGNRRALDGFVTFPKGRTTAVGPALIGGIFSANIPALPHLTVMRSFLVKSACLGRVSRGEPLYLPLYARSIAEVDPDLADCLGVLWWDKTDAHCEAAFMSQLDHLIAYGSDATLSQLRARWPNVRATWHGHRMGFAYVAASALTSDEAARGLAERLAYDFSVFDQHACLAPQACFVETGGEVSPGRFAEHLSEHLARWLDELPPRRLDIESAAALRSAINDAELAETMGLGDVRVLTGSRLQGAVLVETPDAFLPSPLDRFARVVPIADQSALVAYLEPVARYLQCAALAGADDALKLRLARLGVTRLCPPGAMGTPSMLWHHDGAPRLGELVRWCDEETDPPG